jgi:hypothetical protein
MVYFVAYRASSELKDRIEIVQRLRMLGCKQICKSFWQVEDEKVKVVARMLRKNSPVILRRIREVRKPNFKKNERWNDLGSLVVIAYKVPKNMKMGKIKNLLKKAPYIRLCRGVYAFSLHQKQFDKSRSLVDARTFLEFIRQIDENAVVIPRVVIMNSQAVERIIGDVEMRIEKEIQVIVEGYEKLFMKVKRGKIDKQRIFEIRRKFKRRFLTIKKVATFYEEWLRMDFSHILMKPYATIRKVRLLIDAK